MEIKADMTDPDTVYNSLIESYSDNPDRLANELKAAGFNEEQINIALNIAKVTCARACCGDHSNIIYKTISE